MTNLHNILKSTSPTPVACSNSCPSSQWCHPTLSSSVVPFSSCLQSLSPSGSFPMSQFFTSGGQSSDSSFGKESACNAGDGGLIPRSGRSAGEGIGYPLQYSCLENPMNSGAWHEVTKSQTGWSDLACILSLTHYFEFICFDTVSSHGEGEHQLSGVSLYKGTSPNMRA